jgi:hypothetical protein
MFLNIVTMPYKVLHSHTHTHTHIYMQRTSLNSSDWVRTCAIHSLLLRTIVPSRQKTNELHVSFLYTAFLCLLLLTALYIEKKKMEFIFYILYIYAENLFEQQ